MQIELTVWEFLQLRNKLQLDEKTYNLVYYTEQDKKDEEDLKEKLTKIMKEF